MNEKILRENLLCCSNRYYFGFLHGKLIIRERESNRIISQKRIVSVFLSGILLQRLLRLIPRCAICLDEYTFLYSFSGGIYRYSVIDNSIHLEHNFIKGMNNPLSFCPVKDSTGKLKGLLYGEYFWNTEKKDVSIYQRDFVRKCWNRVYSFPENTITHIHRIQFDQNGNRFFILSGDEDKESGIWESDLLFSNVKPVLIGAQKYRSCFSWFEKNYLYYVSDTPLEQNWLYRLNLLDEKLTSKPLFQLPGPCIFGVQKGDNVFFSTTVEGDPTLSKWKYRVSNKLGKGVMDRFVHIYHFSNEKLKEVNKIKKDCLPMWLFQFGNAFFPDTSNSDNVFYCPQSTIEKSGTFIIV